MNLLDEIKAWLTGAQAKPQADPNAGINQSRQWDSPVLRKGYEVRPTPPSATPSPEVAPDPWEQAQALIRQRELAKRIIPEGTWNR